MQTLLQLKTCRLMFIGLLILCTRLNATTFYVTPSGAGLMNGSSWANAYAGSSLQAAINGAGAGDEVWVAAGVYKPTTGNDREVSFRMKNGITVYGSFAGTESTLSQRILTTAGLTSTLSGDIGNAGNTDNSYKVVFNEQLDSTAMLDGFIISDGNDDRSPTNAGNGLGGGIYNHGPFQGGFCHAVYRNCVITANSASWGGGAFNNGYNGGSAEPRYINCIFDSNHATIEAGGMDSYGVAGNASPILINCAFYSNTAATNVGAMFAWGGNAGGHANPVLINCIFANNKALNGFCGAFIADNRDENGTTSSGTSNVTLVNCIVWNNTATGAGPQFYILGDSAHVIATYSDIDLTGQTAPHVLSGAQTENIQQNPRFANIGMGAGADGKWMTADDGLQLTDTSPCINKGINTGVSLWDMLQEPRIADGTVDMGAYEYQGIISSIQEQKRDVSFYVYPNPSDGIFIIESDEAAKPVPYKLTDVTGRVISSGTTERSGISIDLTAAEAGIYFYITLDTVIKLIRR